MRKLFEQNKVLAALLLAVGLLLMLGAASCGPDEQPLAEEEVLEEEPLEEEPFEEPLEEEPLEDEIFADATILAGKTVTLSGEVREVIDPHAFRIGGPVFIEPLLVVGADNPDLSKNDAVLVTGRVLRFELASAEEELDVDLEDELYEPFEREHAVVAHQVKLLKR